MKFTVSFKDPDVVSDACLEAAKEMLQSVQGIDEEEREELVDTRAAKLRDFTDKWVEYGEYIRVEFDTKADTAIVVKRK